MVNKTL